MHLSYTGCYSVHLESIQYCWCLSCYENFIRYFCYWLLFWQNSFSLSLFSYENWTNKFSESPGGWLNNNKIFKHTFQWFTATLCIFQWHEKGVCCDIFFKLRLLFFFPFILARTTAVLMAKCILIVSSRSFLIAYSMDVAVCMVCVLATTNYSIDFMTYNRRSLNLTWPNFPIHTKARILYSFFFRLKAHLYEFKMMHHVANHCYILLVHTSQFLIIILSTLTWRQQTL